MAVNIQFDPSQGSQNQTVKVSGGCNPGIDETIQFQVQTEDGSKTEIINVTQEGKREVLMVSDGQGGYTEFMPSDGGTFNVVKEEWKENPDCGPANSVYVYTVDGQLVKPEEWDTANNDQAVGVAVVSDNCKFAISKGLPMQNNIAWSISLNGTDIAELTNYTISNGQTDFAGQSNTNIIRTQASSENNAANYCYAQILNGKNGYLPAAGELYTIWEYKADVDNALTIIGSKTISERADELTSYTPWFYSSTEFSSDDVLHLYWDDEPFPFPDGIIRNDIKNFVVEDRIAFPFFPLTETGGGTEQPEPINTYFVDSDPNPALNQDGSTDKSWIVGRRCLAKKTDNGVAICYLDENNSELFHDGVTPAVLDGTMGQWMTDLPEYYFHVDESVEGTHKFQVLSTEQADWKKSRRVLLGVTKSVTIDDKMWSISGRVADNGGGGIKTYHNRAISCGDGFDIIDYETHCKIIHFFYTKYANRNPKEISDFGDGSNQLTDITGVTSSIGNIDGKSGIHVSFLGIEDFYGGEWEFVGGLNINEEHFYIYEGYEDGKIPTVPYREFISQSNESGYISDMAFGEYADMIPVKCNGEADTYYCDRGKTAGDPPFMGMSKWCVLTRSGIPNLGSSRGVNGIASFNLNLYSQGGTYYSSRLQYRGNIEVIDDPATFIAMPVGF